jgi:quercetin dioxygenase-like cupin family protein
MIAPEDIKWQPMPPGWADGPPPSGYTLGHSEVAITEGDPAREGAPFVIRIRSTAGTPLPPHWHPVDEHITVLSGVFCVGIGDTLDEKACRDMPAGS